MRAIIAETANNMLSIIVELNNVFSNPLRVWNPDAKLSPNAPPKPAADCCNKIAAINKIESPIWTYGNVETRDDIDRAY